MLIKSDTPQLTEIVYMVNNPFILNSKNQISSIYLMVSWIAVVIVLSSPVKAQPAIDDQSRFNSAMELYDQGAYEAARTAFSKIKGLNYAPESSYYLAVSAIKAGHLDGEILINRFLNDYSHHVYAANAYEEIANFYFNKGQYQKALDRYNRSDLVLAPELLFNKGFCEFQLDNYDEALLTFEKLEGSYSSLEQDAAYFQAYIYFVRDDDERTYAYLETGLESASYGKSARELYASMLYKQGKYEDLIEWVEKELNPVENGLTLNLLAHAQYKLEKYRSASGNYKNLLKTYGDFRSEKNYFNAGFSSFKIEKVEDAIDYFNKAALAQDSVGAYASYYLGVIHSRRQNWPFAITSFKNCTKYSTDLRADAFYLQARAHMSIPNYENAIETLLIYRSQFPQGKHIGSVDQMLGLCYAQTNNYDVAIRYIEELDHLTPQLKQTYQRTSFLKGVNLFNDKKFEEAAVFFQKALLHDENQEITQKTFFWMGETLSLLQDYEEALFYYNSVEPEPDQLTYLKSIYGLGYSHFNLKNYEASKDAFLRLESTRSETLDKNYLSDALLRVADCQFALKAYKQGIASYEKALKSGSKNEDHIYFQTGLLHRYLEDYPKARQSFTQLIKEKPRSPKAEQAYFQIAQMDFQQGDEKNAIISFQKFLDKYPANDLVPYALLNQAIAYDNVGDHLKSITNYKTILDQYPKHQTANSALLGLQDKNTNGHFDEFAEYVEKYKQANPNSDALENIEFETARAHYYNQKYDLAISSFEEFLSSYPQSSLTDEAAFLIGEAYYRLEQWNESLTYFNRLKERVHYAKYPKVLYRMASVLSVLGEVSVSNELYYQLAQVSNSSRNTIYVQNGLMKNYFALSVYDSAIHYGHLLLNNPRVDALVGAEANLIIGKSYYAQGSLEPALQNLLPLVSNTPDERGAEAYYFISKIYFDQADYERALESLFVLTNNFQAYEKWVGTAYLLMADIYIETNELFQARATLQSLIENVENENVKNQARQKLNEIQDPIDSNDN